jgi:hypothetical protein
VKYDSPEVSDMKNQTQKPRKRAEPPMRIGHR